MPNFNPINRSQNEALFKYFSLASKINISKPKDLPEVKPIIKPKELPKDFLNVKPTQVKRAPKIKSTK